MEDDRSRIDGIVAGLREAGFMVRMTEWTEGFQCGAVLRGDTRVAFFSGWRQRELEAWEETLDLVEGWREHR